MRRMRIIDSPWRPILPHVRDARVEESRRAAGDLWGAIRRGFCSGLRYYW
jgi:hypothetical protein